MKPLRALMELFIDRLDKDGTTASIVSTVDNESDATTTTVTTTPTSTTRALVTTDAATTTTTNNSLVEPPEKLSAAAETRTVPFGNRWAVSSPNVDLSGHYNLVVTDDFKRSYDRYLERLGQPAFVRSVALSVAGQTTEEVLQLDHGRSLMVVGRNIRGTWSRTLVASGTDGSSTTPHEDGSSYRPLRIPILSADSEQVESESWWESGGTVHVSWLRGVTRYGGGQFESRRYMDGEDIYVCETTFHPNDPTRQPNSIVWKFQRRADPIP
jgi:hypothetical protein